MTVSKSYLTNIKHVASNKTNLLPNIQSKKNITTIYSIN
jgi:hypothetical protein